MVSDSRNTSATPTASADRGREDDGISADRGESAAATALRKEAIEVEDELLQGRDPAAFNPETMINLPAEVFAVYHVKKAEIELQRLTEVFILNAEQRQARRQAMDHHETPAEIARLQFEHDMQIIFDKDDALLSEVRSHQADAADRLDVLKSCAVRIHHRNSDGTIRDLYGVWDPEAEISSNTYRSGKGQYVDFDTGKVFDRQTQQEFDAAHPGDLDHRDVLPWQDVEIVRQQETAWRALGDDIARDEVNARENIEHAGDDPARQAAVKKAAADREAAREGAIKQLEAQAIGRLPAFHLQDESKASERLARSLAAPLTGHQSDNLVIDDLSRALDVSPLGTSRIKDHFNNPALSLTPMSSPTAKSPSPDAEVASGPTRPNYSNATPP